MKTKHFFISFFILFLIFIGSIFYDFISLKNDEKIISKYNLKLKGKIIKKEDFFYGHDYGFVLIDIYISNYGNFDPRNKNEEYFFIIKNDKCVLIISGLSEIKVNDEILINGKTYNIYRNGKSSINSTLVMLPNKYCENPDVFLNSNSTNISK